jgi:hypothetical protein
VATLALAVGSSIFTTKNKEKQRNLAEAFDAPATDYAADTNAVTVNDYRWAGCRWDQQKKERPR